MVNFIVMKLDHCGLRSFITHLQQFVYVPVLRLKLMNYASKYVELQVPLCIVYNVCVLNREGLLFN